MLIAVDTGGTKTLVASFDEHGKLGEMLRFLTPVTPSHYIDMLSDFLIKLYQDKDVDAIVIGIPATILGDVFLGAGNLPWRNFNVVEAVRNALEDKEASFAKVPIVIENDANLAGLAEVRSMKTIPARALYITVSTGIGTGFITDGRIDPGLAQSEGGLIELEWKGRLQRWEHFASGKAIKRTFGKYARDIKSKRIWNQVADRISRGLVAIITIARPEVIIVGGSIGTYFDEYEVKLEQYLHERLPSYFPKPVIIQAKHPEQAVIYGCYYYALDHLTTR